MYAIQIVFQFRVPELLVSDASAELLVPSGAALHGYAGSQKPSLPAGDKADCSFHLTILCRQEDGSVQASEKILFCTAQQTPCTMDRATFIVPAERLLSPHLGADSSLSRQLAGAGFPVACSEAWRFGMFS